MKKLLASLFVLLLSACNSNNSNLFRTFNQTYSIDFDCNTMSQISYGPSQASSYLGNIESTDTKNYLHSMLFPLSYFKTEKDNYYIKDGSFLDYAYIICFVDEENRIIFEFSNSVMYVALIKDNDHFATFGASLPMNWKSQVEKHFYDTLDPKPYNR